MTIQDPKLAQYRRLVRIGFAVISMKNTVTSRRTTGKTRRIAYLAEGEISLFPISRAAILSSRESFHMSDGILKRIVSRWRKASKTKGHDLGGPQLSLSP